MATYAGNCDSSGTAPGGMGHVGGGVGYTVWNYNKTYACPGSGSQDIVDISAYADWGGGTSVVRLAIYTSDGSTLMAEGAAPITINNGDGPGWKGHQSGAAVTQYSALTGGVNYRIVATYAAGGFVDYYYTTAGYTTDDTRYNTTSYSTGFPATAPTGTDFTAEAVIRFGVNTASGSSPTLSSITPSSGYANATVAVKLLGVAVAGTNLNAGSPAVNVPAGWSVTNLNVSSGIAATFDMTIPAGESPATYSITFTTVNGTSGPVSFTVPSPGATSAGGVSNQRGNFVN